MEIVEIDFVDTGHKIFPNRLRNMLSKDSMNLFRTPAVILVFVLIFCDLYEVMAQPFMTNVEGRNFISLNGNWKVIIDPFSIGSGDWQAYYKDRKAKGNKDFVEYSFDMGPSMHVPGDFNSQLPELNYFESSVWYKKSFNYKKKKNTRLFIYFGAVNYKAQVYCNSKKTGTHEGGFTPFQFELTDYIQEGENSIIVESNNARTKDGIPGIGFDWFNYGGITRDVMLIETPETFIEDYLIQLKKNNAKQLSGFIKLNGKRAAQKISFSIPEIKFSRQLMTNAEGFVRFEFPVTIQRWTPENPKRYKVQIVSETDSIKEDIGLRNIAVKGIDILLNDKPIFLKGVCIHEEIPQRRARAYSEQDALILLNWAKELGCNFVRLVHYPHNEHMVRLAEKMGLMVWEEIPVYQGIDFAGATIKSKMSRMLNEMIQRDKNRGNVIIWSLSNETHPSKERDIALTDLIREARTLDSTRLIASAFDNIISKADTVTIADSINNLLDIISINEYFGWYKTWPKTPGELQWFSAFGKPLVMSEFGGEALFGNDKGKKDTASTWSEEYQEQIFIDQFKMLQKIPFLRGTSPWILADYRSPTRNNPLFQNGWNRKGLLSDKGEKKKAWYIVEKFYRNH